MNADGGYDPVLFFLLNPLKSGKSDLDETEGVRGAVFTIPPCYISELISDLPTAECFIAVFHFSASVMGGISGAGSLGVSGISCSLVFLCEKQGASFNGKVAQ